jgi:hypothetical protein
MAETFERFEFASPEWVTMLRGIVEEGLAGQDLTGINFSLCEEFTDPPARLRRGDEATIGYYVRVENGGIEVGDHPIDASFKIIGDYAAMREYALRPFSPTSLDPDTAALRQRMIEEGKLRVVGARPDWGAAISQTDLHNRPGAEWPGVISRLDLHNRARVRTL